jgi:hypothetical protein
MRKGLRKMVISSAALLLLFALVAPTMSATDSSFSTSANPTGTSSSDNPYTPPASNPDGSTLEPANEPVSEPEENPDPDTPTGEIEEPSQPEKFLPEIPVVDEDPGDPDNPEPSILKIRGKSNPKGRGYSGNNKKMK